MSGRGTTYQSDVGALRSVLLSHARDAFRDEAALDRQWRDLGYTARPDRARAIEEYDRFAAMLLAASGADLHYLPPADGLTLDALYARDASIPCSKGMILCNMGKAARRGEPVAQEAAFRAAGIPICGAISGDGRLEGGDVVWLDERTLAVGRGYRTNDEGIRQLQALLQGCAAEVLPVPLPHWRGPADVFHLMSVLSPLDRDLALVYSPLLPVPFRETLRARGFELVDVPDAEFESMGCNVLALAPRKAAMISGNPETRRRLEKAGVEVLLFQGDEICRKGSDGPTCLTRPILRIL